MAAVVEQKAEPGAKFSSQVDEQIAQATSRIRVHDLMLGGLSLAAMTAVYATAMIVLDKTLNLSELVRQLSLVGFLAAFGTVAYFLIVRPLRSRINPLYAAALVEDTIEDAKNSVTGYVDAQEKGNVHGAVKAAMSAKAAKAVSDADVNQAVDHRSLLIAGGVLIAFLITLAVLFFIFRPPQFKSLAGRAFLPFTSTPIASRTQITLLKPDPAEPMLSSGQTITVAVHIGGKVPAKTDPARARVLIRHNPLDPNYDELPMQEGETSRDWNLKVPEYLVQNGFWYKVAAGDSETPEYHVTVRSLPMFTDFEVNYEYPKYTRKPNEKNTDPNLRVYRGTKVTLLARTNREVKEGVLKFEQAGIPPVAGKLVAGKPDSLSFTFTATEATRYRLSMTTTAGERSADAPPYVIALDTDSPPTVAITKPELPETSIPANGQLSVDGTVGDDFGIDKVRLRLRVDGRDLAPVPYEGGKSFKREKDGTWPNDLSYKGSVDLTKLTYADELKFEPKENVLIEFWLEAIDNCTETKPVAGWGEKPQPGQVGKSEPRKIRLTAPKTDEDDKKQLAAEKNQRRNEEQQHNKDQQQKFDNEKRDPQPQQDPGAQPQKDDPTKQDGKQDGKQDPKQDTKQDGKKDGTEGKKDTKQDTTGGMGGMTDPKTKPEDKKDPKDTKGGENPKTPPENKKENTGAGNTGMGNTDPKMPETKKDNTTPGGKDQNPPKGGMGDNPPKAEAKKDMPPQKGGENTGMGGMGDMNMGSGMQPETAPPPKSEEDKDREKRANQLKEELDKSKGPAGDAKGNPDANADQNRTDPAQAKKQPPPMPDMGESQPKEGPKPSNPMNPMDPKGDKGGASESKGEGAIEKPTDPNPTPKPQPEAGKGNPSERREEPLGGNPSRDKPTPEPKKDGTQPPKEPGKDPASGACAKPPSEKKPDDPMGNPMVGDDQVRNPGDAAGSPKPNMDPARGQDKKPQQAKSGGTDPKEPPKGDQNAGAAKPDKAEANAAKKPAPPDNMAGKQPDVSETKEQPKDPMNAGGGSAAEDKPDPKNPMNPPMGGMGKGMDRAEDKPADPKQNPPSGGSNADPKQKDGKKLTEQDRKELEDAAKNLNNPDADKRKEAQDKLDKAIGQDKRKELEQAMKDAQSDDPAKREAGQKKLDDLKKQAEAEAKGDEPKKDQTPRGKDGKKLSDKEIDELANKLEDLASEDATKREAAEKQFDEKLGKEKRKEIQDDLRKKLDQLKEAAKKDPKKLTEEEIRQMQDKLRDLDSPDQATREAAEKAFDEKFGKEKRKEIQNEVRRQNEDFKKRVAGPDTNERKPAEEADPKNKLKTAQLQLEEFEKNRYNKDLQDRLGWTQQDLDKFLEAQREYVKRMEKEAAKNEEEARNRPETAGEPTIRPGGPGLVENRVTDIGKGATGTGAVYSPPGFEKAREDFKKALDKLQPKK